MSETEKNNAVQISTEKMEKDELSPNELDTVAGGVLALQQLKSDESLPDAASSHYSVGCSCQEN